MNATVIKVIAVLGLVAAIIFAAVKWYGGVVADASKQGQLKERAEWQAKELKRQQAEAVVLYKANELNLREKQDQEAKARKVSDDYQKELTAARDYQPAAGELHFPAGLLCDAVTATAQSAGASGLDGGTTAASQLPEAVRSALREFEQGNRRLAKDADAQTAISRGLQRFARVNGFYGDPEKK
jgi:hypothetical protein